MSVFNIYWTFTFSRETTVGAESTFRQDSFKILHYFIFSWPILLPQLSFSSKVTSNFSVLFKLSESYHIHNDLLINIDIYFQGLQSHKYKKHQILAHVE